VTRTRLSIAKWQARELFRAGGRLSRERFRNFALRKYRCKRREVAFDDGGALRRIRDAVLFHDDPCCRGETDGAQIRISAIEMTHAELVGTLLHEAMHFWCAVRGRSMSVANEHHCMTRCGDHW